MGMAQIRNTQRFHFIEKMDLRIGRDPANGNQWAVISPISGNTWLGDTLKAAIDNAIKHSSQPPD